MRDAEATRQKLCTAARAAFWQRGYSNVSLREIARDAGVDVALVSRYFGGKQGLFAATLDGAFHWPDLLEADDPVDVIVAKYADPALSGAHLSVMQLVALNANDPDVGPLVMQAHKDQFWDPMTARLGGPDRAPALALLLAVLIGADTTRHVTRLPGIADADPDRYAAMLRHMLQAALDFRP